MLLIRFVVLLFLFLPLAIFFRVCLFSNRGSYSLTFMHVGFLDILGVVGGFAGVAATVANVFVAVSSRDVRVATSGGVIRDSVAPLCWFSSPVASLFCIVEREVCTRSQSARSWVLCVIVSWMVLKRTSVLFTLVRTLSSMTESIACFFFMSTMSLCSLNMMPNRSGEIIFICSSSFIRMVSLSVEIVLVKTSLISRFCTPCVKYVTIRSALVLLGSGCRIAAVHKSRLRTVWVWLGPFS